MQAMDLCVPFMANALETAFLRLETHRLSCVGDDHRQAVLGLAHFLLYALETHLFKHVRRFMSGARSSGDPCCFLVPPCVTGGSLQLATWLAYHCFFIYNEIHYGC